MITKFSIRYYLSISDKACKPRRENGKITFRLNLANIYECSITKVVDTCNRVKYSIYKYFIIYMFLNENKIYNNVTL